MSRHVACRWLTLSATATVLALAIGAFGASAASADTSIVGLGGWQVQSTAQATQAAAQISTPGFPTGSWLHVRPDDAGAVGTEVNALVQTGHCPNVFFSTNMKDCFGYMDQIGADTIRAVLGAVVVPHRLPRRSRQLAVHRPDRQRRRRAGRRVGQRPRDRDAGHRAGRLHALHVRHHEPAPARTEHPGPRGLPEQPEHDVHARQRRLDADSAGQQHRHPVPHPAAHLGPARAVERARHPGRRPGSVERGADREGRRDQPRRHGPDGRARGGHPAAARMADPRQPHRDRCAGSDANVHVHAQRRSEPRHPPPERVVALRDGRPAALRTAHRAGATGRRAGYRVRGRSASGRSRLAWSAPRPAMDSHRTGRASSASTAWRSCSGAAVGRRTCC